MEKAALGVAWSLRSCRSAAEELRISLMATGRCGPEEMSAHARQAGEARLNHPRFADYAGMPSIALFGKRC
jgi:hypothetical protein